MLRLHHVLILALALPAGFACRRAPEQSPQPDPQSTVSTPAVPSPSAPSGPTDSGHEAPPPPEPGLPPPNFNHWGLRWSEKESRFRVHAPIVKSMEVWIYDGARSPDPTARHPMTATRDGSFEVSVAGNLAGKFYRYHVIYSSGHSTEVVDPFATHLVASGTRALIAEPGTTHPAGWVTKPRVQAPTSPLDAIIYEAHLRDLTIHSSSGVKNKGGYLGWTEASTTLDGKPGAPPTALAYMKQLGVTHVHLLPVMDFENDEAKQDYNWGYMTEGWFSPEGMYATDPDDASRVLEFKQLILALHQEGIGLIMDVVFNHAAHRSPLQALGGDKFFRTWPDGSWCNGSHCGNDLRTENPWVREFIIQSCEHWVREYDVDGFRFDLMGLIDAETMRQVAQRVRSIKPGIILYGEPWASGATAMNGIAADKNGLRTIQGIAAFNDDIRNSLKGMPKGKEPGFIMDGSRKEELFRGIAGQENWGFGSPDRMINYMTAHDDMVLNDKLVLSLPGISISERRARVMQGYLVLLTSQGVPFLHAGCEFLRTKRGNDNSYNAGDPINAIDWNLLVENDLTHRWTRALISLRKEHPLFRLRDHESIRSRLRFHHMEKPGVLMFTINGEGLENESWKEAMVVVNTSADTTLELDLPAGQWTVRLDSRRETTGSIEGRTKVPPLAAWLAFR
ncbi:MAG: type I pullulanase [Verrucomicrobiales bacterium]